jgi:SAM-dependent methyltransferase
MEPKEYWEKHGRAFAALYDQDTWFNRVFRKGLFLRARFAVEMIRQKPGATVLDVGCGSGRNSVLFIKEAEALQVIGVDISEEMLSMARETATRQGVADRCTFVRQDFMKACLGGQRFDYSVALGVMDYLRDPVPMLRRMRDHTIYAVAASFPGYALLRMTLRKIRYGLRGCEVFMFSAREVREAFLSAGFNEVHVEKCGRGGWMGVGLLQKTGPE